MSAATLAGLLPEAEAIGHAWAQECASDLRSRDRGIVGAWPGTVREARSLVMTRLPAARTRPSLDTELLQQLAHATYDAARKSWQAICEPDPEP